MVFIYDIVVLKKSNGHKNLLKVNFFEKRCFSTTDFTRNIINFYNDKNPPNYVDLTHYVQRNLYRHPRDVIPTNQYFYLIKLRQLVLYKRGVDTMTFYGHQFEVLWNMVKEPSWRRNILLRRYMIYWPLPVEDDDSLDSFYINWDDYPRLDEMTTLLRLLESCSYAELDDETKLLFYFITRYFHHMWWLFQKVRFLWEFPSYFGPKFRIDFENDGRHVYYTVLFLKKFFKDLLFGIFPEKGFFSKEYWRMQDEYQTWITTHAGRYSEINDYGKLIKGFVPKNLDDDRLVGYQFPTDIGLSLGEFVSDYFFVKFLELREYSNRWWHIYRGFNYRFFWRILRLVEKGYLNDIFYFSCSLQDALIKHLTFVGAYFRKRDHALSSGIYKSYYWYFMFNFWSLHVERFVRLLLYNEFILMALYTYKPELMVYDRAFMFSEYPRIYKFAYFERENALAVDVKFYITACEFVEIELGTGMASSQHCLYWYVESFSLSFSLTEVHGPLGFYDNFFFNYSRYYRNLMYTGFHAIIFLSLKQNELFGQRSLYKNKKPLEVFYFFIVNYNSKIVRLGFFGFYRLLLFFMMGVRHLLMLRFTGEFSYYFTMRQFYIEELVMFLRFITLLWWVDKIFVLFFRLVNRRYPRIFELYYNFVNFIYWRIYNAFVCHNDKYQVFFFIVGYLLNEEEDFDLRLHIFFGELFQEYYIKGFYESIGLTFLLMDDYTNDLCLSLTDDTIFEDDYEYDIDTTDEEEDENIDEWILMSREEWLEEWPYSTDSSFDTHEHVLTEDRIRGIEDTEEHDEFTTTRPYRVVERGWNRFYVKNYESPNLRVADFMK